MTTPTDAAVPSTSPLDLLFNAEKLDESLNSSALTYVDRKGVTRLTLAGAVARISAVNPRGAWTTGTLYNARDLVSNGGTWYIALSQHTSGATFAGDQSTYWRVYQGVTSADLASTASDALGDALLGVKKTWTGSQARTQHGVNEEVATIYDALPSGFVTTNDATAYIQLALDSGVKVVDFLGLALKCDAVTVPAGVWAKNVNFTKYTAAAGNVVLVNTGSMVTGKIAGTGLTSAIQRCIYPAADGVTDVSLNVDVSNATYGVHAQYLGTNTEANYPKRWSGYIYAHDIVGTAGVSEGYGVILSPALACQFRVNCKTIARHAVYLSAGASDCIIDVTVDGCSNYAVQLFSNTGQPATERNTVRVKAKNLSENVAGQGGAVGIIQKAHRNTISVDLEGNNATSYGILVEGARGGPYPLAKPICGTRAERADRADRDQIGGWQLRDVGQARLALQVEQRDRPAALWHQRHHARRLR